jgi:hypothetical protein
MMKKPIDYLIHRESSFEIKEDEMECKITCVCCGFVEVLIVDLEGFNKWHREGALIQDALPELPPEKRDILVANMCSRCLDIAYQEYDEE